MESDCYMWKMKNNDLEARIGIPDGFKVKGGDGRAVSSWNEVKNARSEERR